MLSNFHTHTSFCDGEDLAEDMVVSAIKKGFDALGFSGHGYTDFDLSYCINDVHAYKAEIMRLKEKYKNQIQIYLGLEEDVFGECNRAEYDYIIGSLHYFLIDGKFYPVDSDYDCIKKCVGLAGDSLKLAENYYNTFCEYILRRKPDIVGHFDLLTKFDEKYEPYFLGNDEYNRLAEKYLSYALESDCIFEVNTGAISRGYRKTPYPNENLLYLIKKKGGKIILSSDTHSKDTLDYGFCDASELIRDIGFQHVYILYDNEFRRIRL